MINSGRMARSHRGMRNGISLVEMLIAVILFGVIATISFSYYKNYYDTSFAAKQLRVYVVIDQATQISTAYDTYEVKNGIVPTTVQDLVDDRLLTAIPVAQPFISSTGWEINGTYEVNGTTANNDSVFIYPVDSTVVSGADKLDYCNILNNTSDTNKSLDPAVSNAASLSTTALNWTAGMASGTSNYEYFHCSDEDASGADFDFVFVKSVDPL